MERLVSFGFLALPTVFITLSLVGALLALMWRRTGIGLAVLSSLCLYAAATPALSSFLLREIEAQLPQDVDLAGAQAIVVLGGEVRLGNRGDIPDRLGAQSLERVVMAAAAYRRLAVPVEVNGATERGGQQSEATLMKAVLEADFAVPVRWVEERSRTTWENALFAAQLLQPEQVTRVVLVSHAWHLPRALWAFERVGLKPLPWPAPRTAQRMRRVDDFLPTIRALTDSFYALHELVGGVYYRLRH
jgi:uncharacterized SAM-binding protein YcdF (DUF218 family)